MASTVEGLPDRVTPHRPTVAPNEDPIASRPLRSLARVSLGLGIECGPPVLKQLDPASPDGDGARHQVDVISAQTERFTAGLGQRQSPNPATAARRAAGCRSRCRGGLP